MDEQRRLGKTAKEILPNLEVCSQSLDKIMEDARLMLGLSQEEVVHLLSLLEKSDFGMLHFFRGNIDIRFDKLFPKGKNSGITLKVGVEDGDGNRSSNEYAVQRAFIRFAKEKFRKHRCIAKKAMLNIPIRKRN